MFRNIQSELPKHFLLPRPLRTPSLSYVDDTLLLAIRPTDLTKLLHLVEHHSQTHNLQLNREKCKILIPNDDGVRILFMDGTQSLK